SRDGQTLVWQSWANNLAGQDFNLWGDIYVLQTFATNSITPHGPFSITDIALSSLAEFSGSGNAITLTWPLGSGTNYLVLFKNNLNDPLWQTNAATARLLGNQGFAIDVSPAAANRFYRVVAY